ncbi:hypothetical protein TNIN_479831 [Trichonephila inaurata madagascariensis]|uniref:Small integral membrane protein 4 n=1 Tax=Trichonephila inaurata madagascariensis TaxID=2747483 RepID=A0A8X6XW61_9ARAC|nr:hypothetical protein TNIN_479831 [Trichonephila inaurata madagascariensis]
MKRAIGAVLNKWPGKERFGVYRFLPLFFIFGAALEFTMIKWEFHGVNFFILQTSSFSLLLHFVLFLNMDISFIIDETYKRRKAEEIIAWELKENVK